MRTAWVALSLVRGIGGVTMRVLLEQFGSAEAVLQASERDLRKVRGIGAKTAQAITGLDLRRTDAQMARWQREGVTLLYMDDGAYPHRLRDITDCPPTLFSLGNFKQSDAPHIAVVGTRNPSDQARQQAKTIGRTLANESAVVISGMATGIDGITQHAVLEIPGSYTVGVLGSGVLKPYPPENTALAHMLRMYGALLCEIAPDATVSTPGLVARNRIITGLADAVIIVETVIDGGAMHAAKAAVRQGRTLYAVDNPASGNRQLIDEGMAVSLSPDMGDLLRVLG
ncbi:MAG: DNA-processing protein DprA [Chloroflexota bacterium]